ncbi:MAG: DNA-binding response regulator [Chloroflexota bacterium]|nr:MAG: DNA-binding response regulator [Chloroflexota bacterium]
MIRVLICDDQDVVREGLHAILRTTQGISVVGVAGDGATAIELTLKHKPDLVLMDLNMPGMTGIHATRVIRAQAPEVQVLALTTYDADEWILDAIRAGAAGYLLKDTPRAGLVKAIEGTCAGQTFVDPAVAGKLFTHVARSSASSQTTLTTSLNTREQEILKLLARGMSNAEIAAQLFLSEGTVRNYVSSLFSKLNVNDRTQAAVIALRYGLAD